MFKRALSLTLLVTLLVYAAPARPQTITARDWIPADFAGFVTLNTADMTDTFTGVGMGAVVLAILQPSRPNFPPIESLDTFFPLHHLDVEGASFTSDILPWLGDEVIIAYRDFHDGLAADLDDMLLILPTADALQAASSMRRIIQGQDMLERETYRDTLIYQGDKTAVALTPQAVLIGQDNMIRAALDVMHGAGERLVDQPGYRAVSAATPGNVLAEGYLDGRLALSTLSYIISGSDSAEPLLAALGEVLREQRGDAAFEQVLLGDALDGVSISLRPDTLRRGVVRATLTLYDADQPEMPDASQFNSDLLHWIPQNAMILQTGTDAAGMGYNVLYALPLTNFAGQMLGAFPVSVSPGAASGLITQPSADDLRLAVAGLSRTLAQVLGFSLEDNLLAHLDGSYAMTLLPRPNNVNPLFGTPYDVLIVSEAADASAAIGSITLLLRIILGVDEPAEVMIDNLLFNVLQLPNGETGFALGVVDDLLVIATGDALRLALDARRGDNRLISREKWESVSRDAEPQFYLDLPAYYSTFLPQPGGAVMRQANQLGAWTTYLGDGVYQVHVIVTLPGEIG